MITAAAKDEHSIAIYEIGSNIFKGTLYITSGKIIGQPMVSNDKINVTFTEYGKTWIGTWNHNLTFLSRVSIG